MRLGRPQFEASLGKQLARTHLYNKQRKMDWRCGLSPEFKPKCHEKKKSEKYNIYE
jgi:hypothetical protein